MVHPSGNLSRHFGLPLGSRAGTARLHHHGEAAKIKGRVHCFSMQVIINKCFLIGANPSFRFQEKRAL